MGSGWTGLAGVFSGDEGVIYAVRSSGDLYWYRHLDRLDGGSNWAYGNGAIGSGWAGQRALFSGGDGIVHVVRRNGVLDWYRHNTWLTGTANWDGPEHIGTGWLFP